MYSPLGFLLFLVPLLAPMTSCQLLSGTSDALRPGYYSQTCPDAELIVREVIRKEMLREARSAASVMRLQFHDCFVNVSRITPVISENFLVMIRPN